ncbi:MAG: FKBP-type peptidyl-prolyl cis-trans isomerase [Cytophagaceae bacterium]
MTTISKNKVVRMTYELSSGNELIQKVNADQPFTFLYGVGGLLEEFEQNIADLKVGDTFNFEITAENGYGEIDEEAVVQIPKEAFMVDGKLQDDILEVGNVLPMRDSDGNFLEGRIIEMDEASVTMDFNHPLAGKDLHFKGEILAIREATAEEIDHGHVHGEGGHHH